MASPHILIRECADDDMAGLAQEPVRVFSATFDILVN